MRDRLSREAERGLVGPVAGVDEVGRGSLSGPVVAAAVILPGLIDTKLPAFFDDVRDSKAISANRRLFLSEQIRGCCVIGVGAASPAEIDSLNIKNATFLAMSRAVSALVLPPGHLLVDGNLIPRGVTQSVTTIVRGDATCLAIAAASIVAKVERDRIMAELDVLHPGYGWADNAGYGTTAHCEAIRKLGPTTHHRRSFGWGEVDTLFGQAH